MRVYIGGDSLASSFGSQLATNFGKTGKISAVWDSRPSSGLINTKFFDWNKQAKSINTKYNPELIFFIIGTNDANTAVKGNPKGYAQAYKDKLISFVNNFPAEDQKIYFVLAPSMRDKTLNANLQKINTVIKDFAAEYGFATISSANVLSPANVFTLSIYGSTVRTDDGVHITAEGGKILSDYIYKQIGELIDLTNINNVPAIAAIKAAGCCVTPKTSTTNTVPTKGKTTTSSSNSTTTTTTELTTSSTTSSSTPTSLED